MPKPEGVGPCPVCGVVGGYCVIWDADGRVQHHYHMRCDRQGVPVWRPPGA